MRFEVDARGRRHTIEVEPSANGWAVHVNERRVWVDLARTGARWSLLIRHSAPAIREGAAAEGTAALLSSLSSHEVAVEARASGERLVYIDGHTAPVTLVVPTRRVLSRGGAARATAPIAIAAPMPGRVVKMLVKAGDLVTARQGVVVVEAMKMENELRAPHAGRVVEIRAREGEPVEANVVLVVIDPRP